MTTKGHLIRAAMSGTLINGLTENYFDNRFLVLTKKEMLKCTCFSFVRMCFSLFYVGVNRIYLGFGWIAKQNKDI